MVSFHRMTLSGAMKLFQCQNCSLVLFFENRNCSRCGHVLGYLPIENELSTLTPDGAGNWLAAAAPGAWKFCANAQYDACNWLLPAGSPEAFCLACRHNRTVPNLSDQALFNDWKKLEFAKHRLFYTLLRLHLPLPNRNDDAERGLAFDFLADQPNEKVMTGHDEGIITLALIEADDSEREKRRHSMHEPYRTLLGHFRHEIGHYYWDRLVRDRGKQDASRTMFGDDREDYERALKRHYENGAPPNWQENFISTYAASHPWEDFAETWAHYLHIVDSLETAKNFGLQVHPEITPEQKLHAAAWIDPYLPASIEQLVEVWLPLTYALNAMNRSMGLKDIYPFVLSPAVVKKLGFVHGLVQAPPK
jgi:hypothetical protein